MGKEIHFKMEKSVKIMQSKKFINILYKIVKDNTKDEKEENKNSEEYDRKCSRIC